MFKSIIPLLSLGLFSLSALAAPEASGASTKVGYSGKLSSLDAGLGGTVTVKSATSLEITDYTLEDASAPALYWWGSNTDALKDGFRISEAQVTKAASSNTLEISLDAGKTPADFKIVGLWCERFQVNFGQATLAPGDGSAPAATGGNSSSPSATTSGSSSAATESAKSAGKKSAQAGAGAVTGVVVAVGAFVAGLV
ncbi:hypothetical protein BKA65DRAFT_483633 [Rhexocercosporidium sp. MPI-PUGE-AT-0058]|nr:hypothetical protein BKA65DRAFT_483633 [Rhexocercosporidium sp. MPI-PUGE-AT-0058]